MGDDWDGDDPNGDEGENEDRGPAVEDADLAPAMDSDYVPGIPLHVDFAPRNGAELRKAFIAPMEERIPDLLARAQQLPNLTVRRGPYVAIVLEARHTFVLGLWYACVAMCGIAAERIIKDRLRSTVRLAGDEKPPDAAFDQLEYADVSSLARFLRSAGLLSDQVFKAADALCQLRNKYAHARGKKAEVDALKATTLLQVIVEGTVHVPLD